jgi:hypothetical protein
VPVQAASAVRPAPEPAAATPAEDRSGRDDGGGETRAPAGVRERSDGSSGSGGTRPDGSGSGSGSGSGELRDGEDAGVTLTVPAAPAATVTVEGVESGDGGGDGGHGGGD